MVGDRSHDVEGAAVHGIDTIVVGWGGYGRDDFTDTDRRVNGFVRGPVHVASVADLREVLGA